MHPWSRLKHPISVGRKDDRYKLTCYNTIQYQCQRIQVVPEKTVYEFAILVGLLFMTARKFKDICRVLNCDFCYDDNVVQRMIKEKN